MPSAELAEWQAFYVIEPFGPIREDVRAGRIAATVANTIPREKGSKPYRAEEFFPELDASSGPKGQQSEEEQILSLKAWAILSGADIPSTPTPKPGGETDQCKLK